MGKCISKEAGGPEGQVPFQPTGVLYAESVKSDVQGVSQSPGPQRPQTCSSSALDSSCKACSDSKRSPSPGPSAHDGGAGGGAHQILVASGPVQNLCLSAEDVGVQVLDGSSTSALTVTHAGQHFMLRAPCGVEGAPSSNSVSCCGAGVGSSADPDTPAAEVMFDLMALELGAQGFPHDVAKFGAPRAPNEETRMQTVRVLRHMGVDTCGELDALLRIICSVWNAPVSSVTLLDSEHVWMCNACGCGTGHRSWVTAMCPWTLLTPHPEALAVGDLGEDARFAGNAHHQGGTRSYLTAPLVASNGHRLGAICFVDQKPRQFTASDCRLMSNFAELAVRELEKHVQLADRLKQVEEAELSAVYDMRVRDIDEVADTCVMLIDTRVEGWQLLYASRTWLDWTGVAREDCVGRTLAELLEYVHGDPEDGGIVWLGLVRNARECKPFVTPKVRVRDSVGSKQLTPGMQQPLRHSFYLSFKAASTEPLDADTVPVGVPAWVPMETTPNIAPLYFARLYTVPNPPPNSRVNTGVNVSARMTAHQLPNLLAGNSLSLPSNSATLGAVASRLEQMSPVLAATQLFRGLKPSHVLGQGAFGTVWHALWHGTPVALKVIDSEVCDEEDRARVIAEFQLSSSLTHVNVVRTLAHSSTLIEPPQKGKEAGTPTAHMSGASTTSASWLCSGGQQVSVVPCIGLTRTIEQSSANAGTHLIGTLSDKHARAPPPPQLPQLAWPSPAHPIIPTPGAIPDQGSPQHVDTDAGGKPAATLHALPETASHAPALDRPSCQPQTLEDIESDLDELPARESHCGAAPSGDVLRQAAPMPAYVTPMWHALGGLDSILASSPGPATPSGEANNAPMATEVSLVRRVDSDTTRLSGARKVHSGAAGMLLLGHGAVAGSGRLLNPSFMYRTSFEATSDSERGVEMLRRYSSGGLNGRWRRSADASTTGQSAVTTYPFSFRQWVLLEFCDKGSLGEAVDKGRFRVAPHPSARPDLAKLAPTALDIAQGLVYLHSRGVVHGDLTAVNVLLQSASTADVLPGDTRGFTAKLSDFGMSHKLNEAQESVVVGSYGAMTHMAPEVLLSRQVGYKADVYSLGVIIWQMMTGSRPWAGLSHLQVTIAVGHEHRQLQWPSWPDHDPSADLLETSRSSPTSSSASLRPVGSAAASWWALWGHQLTELGKQCCAPDADERPSAEVVVGKLRTICQGMLPAAAAASSVQSAARTLPFPAITSPAPTSNLGKHAASACTAHPANPSSAVVSRSPAGEPFHLTVRV